MVFPVKAIAMAANAEPTPTAATPKCQACALWNPPLQYRVWVLLGRNAMG